MTYEVGSLKDKRIPIKVFLKDIGDAPASNINSTINHPTELNAITSSGGEKIGDIITWKGELKPNEGHIIEYSVIIYLDKDLVSRQ